MRTILYGFIKTSRAEQKARLSRREYNILKLAGTTLGRKYSPETINILKTYKRSTEAKGGART